MYDPKMKYCTVCDDEYMPEIVKCGVCGNLLKSGQEILEAHEKRQRDLAVRKGAITASDDVVTILKTSMDEVKRIAALLENEKIGTLLLGEAGGCGKGCCGSELELKVRREDVALAMEIIDIDFQKMTAISNSELNQDGGFNSALMSATCPACGFTFSTSSSVCPDCGLCFG